MSTLPKSAIGESGAHQRLIGSLFVASKKSLSCGTNQPAIWLFSSRASQMVMLALVFQACSGIQEQSFFPHGGSGYVLCSDRQTVRYSKALGAERLQLVGVQ